MSPETQQWITLRHVGELLARTGDDRTAPIPLGALTNRATAAPVSGANATRLDDVRHGPLPPHHYRARPGPTSAGCSAGLLTLQPVLRGLALDHMSGDAVH